MSLDKKIKILKDALFREKEARRILEDELERKTRTVYEAYESVNNIIQVMGESLIVIDLDGIIKKVNLATIDLLHYSEEELLGKDIGIIIGEAVNIRTLINESPTVSVERTYLTNDGIKIPVLFSSTSLRDLSGKSNGAVCVARDISESKRTAKALQESEKRFKDIAYSMADWIWEVDKQARYTFSSTAARKILGYEPEEIIGKRPFDLMPPEEAERIEPIFLKIVSEKKPIVDLENWNLNKQGEKVCLLTNGVPLLDEEGELLGYRGVDKDITKRKRIEAELHQMARYDTLTGLPNRTLFAEHLNMALARARRNQRVVAFLFMDLDRFKNVNDTLGHPLGDMLLKQVAERLTAELRGADVVARFGGDEYAILQADLPGVNGTGVLAERILKTVSQPYSIQGHEVHITASIGIAIHTPDGPVKPHELLAQADRAMYRAKVKGRNRFFFHNQEMELEVRSYVALTNGLHQALERREFRVHYQPQVDIPSGRIIGLEALLRWRHPERGLLRPKEFIKNAEDSGLIIPLGKWVIREACRQLKAWRDQGLGMDIRMAVNLSPIQVSAPGFAPMIRKILDEARLPHECLELELTEGILMGSSAEMIEVLKSLQAEGTMLSIDDFGTGYSSLKYLKNFPVYKLKIAQEFVLDLPADPDDAAIVSTIIRLGRQMDLMVIAEGVETPEQLAFLLAEGCTEAQGYYFARPQPAEALAPLLLKGSIETK